MRRSETNNLVKGVFASLTGESNVNRSPHANLILNFTEHSVRRQELRPGFLICPFNPARDVYRISNGGDSLLQTTSDRANDCFAEV